MADLTKRLVGMPDANFWDGTIADQTFTALTSTGRTMTLNTLGHRPDYDWVAQFGDVFARSPFVDVRTYGASGSNESTTGGITTGTAQLTLAAVKDFRNGQGIAVAGAGAAGVLLVTTITSGEGTLILTLDDNASTTVAAAAVTHADSPNIDLATVAIAAAGGGCLLFPPGTYNIGANTTIPITTQLFLLKGATIVLGALNFTIQGPLFVGEWQAFDVTGGGTLTLSSLSYIEHDVWDDGTAGHIRVVVAGVSKANFDVAANATATYVIVNSHKDSDGDTQIQVEEAADEDKVRIDIEGGEEILIEADKITFNAGAVDPVVDWATSGQLALTTGTLRVDNKVVFTQTDNNEYIDSETDGRLDIAATTAIDFIVGGTEVMTLDASGAIAGLETTNGPVGTFTAGAAATTAVTNTSVTAASIIFIQPTNAAAATLMAGASSLYISARAAGVSFTVATADAGNAGGTETFNYLVLN